MIYVYKRKVSLLCALFRTYSILVVLVRWPPAYVRQSLTRPLLKTVVLHLFFISLSPHLTHKVTKDRHHHPSLSLSSRINTMELINKGIPIQVIIPHIEYSSVYCVCRGPAGPNDNSNSRFTTTTGQTVELGKPAREVSLDKSAMQTKLAQLPSVRLIWL